MVKPIVVAPSPTSTGCHTITGSDDVIIDGKPATRILADTGGAPIIGPGATTTFINGMPASLPGDAIVSHGLPPHALMTTTSIQSKVFAGTGFSDLGGVVTDGNGNIIDPDSDLGGGPGTGTANIELKLLSFSPQQSQISVSNPNDPCYVERNCLEQGGFNQWLEKNIFSYLKPDCHGPLKFNFTIQNSGSDPCPPFKCRIWEVPSPGYNYVFAANSGGILSQNGWRNDLHPYDSQPYSNGNHLISIPGIPAGSNYSGVAEVPSFRIQRAGGNQPRCNGPGSTAGSPYAQQTRHYFMSVDILGEVTEFTEVQYTSGSTAKSVDAV